jgi:hypothetical protein
MSTGHKGPLSPQNISDFVDHRDDMALELSTFRVLLGNGWWANHGGFYRDPVQDKFRQFDVQGGLELRKNPNTPLLPTTGIRVAAECKNLSPEAPIVVSRMPRTETESYHCLLKRITDRDNAKAVKEVRVIRSTAVHPKPYHSGAPVGKSIVQYQKNPAAKAPDDPYAKWSQALSSCATQIIQAYMKAIVSPEAPDLCFIFPALIVADATLWVVDYDKDGVRGGPQLADEATLFLGQFYDVVVEGGKQKYGVSHLHIYTETGLTNAVPTWNSLRHSKEWERVYKFGCD